jgi:hypothetical protein
MIGLVMTSATTIRADLKIFAARGSTTPSTSLKMDAMSMYGAAMGSLRDEGYTVIQGDIVIGGPQ